MDFPLVAQRVAAVRKAKGITKKDLVTLSGISPTHTSVIERGVKMPNLGTFGSIANALNVSADALLLDIVDRSCENTSTGL